MTAYNKWRARRQLLASTASSAVGAVPRALRQRAMDGPGVNYLHYPPGSGLSMVELSGVLEGCLTATGRPLQHFEVSVQQAAGPRTDSQCGDLYASTVALVQSGHVPTAALQLPRLFAPSRFRVAVVHYELPRIPITQRLGVPFVDELWTTSEFVRDAFAEVTRKPVRVMPLAVSAPAGVTGALRNRLGLTDEYLFAYLFDLASSGERKNPAAVAKAYIRAFPAPRPDVRLLLKSVHASMSPQIWRELEQVAWNRPDVLLVDAYWPRSLIDAFFVDIDCYVSLHRAEGFGLTLATAMAAGKPVIATGYSGNLSFMTEATSVLIPWRGVHVGPDPVYPAEGMWAEPDLAAAAEALQQLAGQPDDGRAIGARARAYVLSTLTRERSAVWLQSNLPT